MIMSCVCRALTRRGPCREHRFKLEESKDWYCDLADLEPTLQRCCKRDGHQAAGGATARILLPGCGNSALGPQIAAAGFGQVTNVDYVSAVIKDMQAKHGCELVCPPPTHVLSGGAPSKQSADGATLFCDLQ